MYKQVLNVYFKVFWYTKIYLSQKYIFLLYYNFSWDLNNLASIPCDYIFS